VLHSEPVRRVVGVLSGIWSRRFSYQLQLDLLELEHGVSNLEVAAEGDRKMLPPTPDNRKRKHSGRQTLPTNLPRVEREPAAPSSA
jgi:hypothetical protein